MIGRTLGAVATALLVSTAALAAQQPKTPQDTTGWHRGAMAGQDTTGWQRGPMGRRAMRGPGWMGARGGWMNGPGMMGGWGGRMGWGAEGGAAGMALRMGFMAPGMLLRLRQPLDLTDAQVTRLEALRDSIRSVHQASAEPTMTAFRDAFQALEGENPDIATFQSKLEQAGDDWQKAAVSMARLSVEARSVLTPDQRQELRNAFEMMRDLRGGRGGWGPMNGAGWAPMNRGPMGHRGARPMPPAGPPSSGN